MQTGSAAASRTKPGKRFSLTSHIPTRPHTMDEAGVGRLPQEVPSVALDQLFLEIHDHLPRDARGKLAQLADEVKKQTEANTAGALETQPSSTEHAILRRVEGTIEARQSSGQVPDHGLSQQDGISLLPSYQTRRAYPPCSERSASCLSKASPRIYVLRGQVRGCSLATRSSSLTYCRCCCYITQ